MSVASGIAVPLVVMIVVCTVGAIWLAGPAAPKPAVLAGFAESIMGIPYGLVGAVILARRSRNRVR